MRLKIRVQIKFILVWIFFLVKDDVHTLLLKYFYVCVIFMSVFVCNIFSHFRVIFLFYDKKLKKISAL